MKKYSLLYLLLLSLVPLFDLTQTGLPVTHDGIDHVARIANFYQNLQDGIMIPRWAPNLNWGYGHPILMFLYPLPSYLASLFHFLGLGLIDSVKLVFGISFVLSGLTIYLWLREFVPTYSAFIGGVLYLFAPYRFVDLYVRGAIGEHVAFIFPPLIFLSLLKISRGYSHSYLLLGILSFSGLILSHNAVILMFLPLLFAYSIYLLINNSHKKIFITRTILIITLGFGISAFFWIPAFYEGKYTLRDIVAQNGYKDNFVSFSKLIYSQWNYGLSKEFSVQIGLVNWLVVILSFPLCFYLRKRKKQEVYMCFGLLIVFLFSLFIIQSGSLFIWERITILQKFQFPWRFLALSVFSSAILGAVLTSFLPKRKVSIVIAVLVIVTVFFSKDFFHANKFIIKPESYFRDIYSGTTDTGESAPIWSVRFMEKKPKAHAEVIGGKATINETNRTTSEHAYNIITNGKAQIRENTLYFPGWSVYSNGKNIPIEYQDPNNRGVITFVLDSGNHNVQVKFGETMLRKISNLISLSSLIITCLVLFFINKFKLWQKYQ